MGFLYPRPKRVSRTYSMASILSFGGLESQHLQPLLLHRARARSTPRRRGCSADEVRPLPLQGKLAEIGHLLNPAGSKCLEPRTSACSTQTGQGPRCSPDPSLLASPSQDPGSPSLAFRPAKEVSAFVTGSGSKTRFLVRPSPPACSQSFRQNPASSERRSGAGR